MSEEFHVDQESQGSYQETPYEDASWEIVGELEEAHEFIPMELPVVKGEEFVVDPMFADYGGLPQSDAPKRWHLPENQAFSGDTTDADHEREIEELKKEFEQKLELAKEAAFEAGKVEGITAGAEKSNERFSKMEGSFGNIAKDLERQIQEILAKVEKDAVQLSLQISKKLLDTAVDINPEYIVEIVREAIGQTGTALIRKVRVSNEDLEFIDVLGVRKAMKEYDGSWEFEGDSTIKSGCVVETSAGEIDYQLDKAWERIRDNVVKVVR